MHLLQSAFIAVLCSCAWAVLEVEQASMHNLALAPLLLGAENACGAQTRVPTQENIFSVADARIVSIVPSVCNTTSDLANASLLWSWSASFPSEAVFPVPSDPRCLEGEIRYFAPSQPSFSGELSYSYGNSSESLSLSSDEPSPVPLNLSAAKLTEEELSTLLIPLPVSLNASVSVTYQFSKSSYSYFCTEMGEYIGCGCDRHDESGTRTFSTALSHSRNFSVEAGPVELLWLNPPLSSRLEGQGTGKVAFFARRMPANISFSFAGKSLGFAQPYLFSVHEGVCGEKITEREFSPSGSVFLNASEPLFPSQLVEKNASYAPFYAEFPWQAAAGKKEFFIFFEDAFSHSEIFAKNFSVRQPLPPSLPSGSSDAMQQVAATDSNTAAALVAPQKQSSFPDFSVLAIAFALPLAIGATALCRRLEWL